MKPAPNIITQALAAKREQREQRDREMFAKFLTPSDMRLSLIVDMLNEAWLDKPENRHV